MNFLNRNSTMSNFVGVQQSRGYSRAATLMAAEVTSSSSGSGGQAPPPHPPNGSILGGPKMTPSALDRIFLKWSGQIKKGEPVPQVMAGDVIMRARSFARIRINVGFLVLGAVASGFMIYSGKQAAKRGESMEKQNLDWHKQIKEDYQKEQAAKSSQ